MNRIVLLLLALALTAGCGQSETTDTSQAAAPAATPAPAAVTAEATPPITRSAPEGAQRIQMAQADLSAVEAAGFVQGRHYTLISPAQPTNTAPGFVEVNEFFMHSCIHCYNLEPFVEAWLETKPDFINFVRVPTTWDAGRILHAQAYYTAESLGIIDEIMMPFFREFHEQGNYLDSTEKLATFFGRFGVSKEDFDSHFNSFSVRTKLNTANQLMQRYAIDSTPTWVINGKYKTSVSQAGGTPEALFELIDVLAAAERSQ